VKVAYLISALKTRKLHEDAPVKLRCFDLRCTTDHHNIAFLASAAPGFHHGSFEIGNIDELAVGALRTEESGWEPAWGPGRHVIGSNFFYYIRDPWGGFAEYFHDIDYIPEQCALGASRLPVTRCTLPLGTCTAS
jgi:hypothetical protein